MIVLSVDYLVLSNISELDSLSKTQWSLVIEMEHCLIGVQNVTS